jgi:tetratricopeptide (TPR) repeat protein
LLPTLGIVQVGSQFAADRYMYLSMLPVIASIIIAVRLVCQKLSLPASVPISVFVISGLALTAITFNQMPYWHDSESLWKKVLEEDMEVPTAHYNLANYYLSINDLERAELEWTATTNLVPTHSMAQNQLGNIEYIRGDLTAALGRYEAAVKNGPYNIEPRYNYAKVLDRLGMTSKAKLNYIQFVELATPEYRQQVTEALKRISQIQ